MNNSTKINELSNKLYNIAGYLRGNMDANKFKDYMLSLFFYKYLSEKTERSAKEFLTGTEKTYEEAYNDPATHETIINYLEMKNGYYIFPENLYSELVSKITRGIFLMSDLKNALTDFEKSLSGKNSVFDNIFSDINLESVDLGRDPEDRKDLISRVLLEIDTIKFDEYPFDILGTAYMILIGKFASDAGKKSGEFFTPIGLTNLVSQLATFGLEEVANVYDPCAGSGSLLMETTKNLNNEYTLYYGQEINATTNNLLRMNLIMHNIPHDKFFVFNGDTLKKDRFKNTKFQVQVSNPPYSLIHDLTSGDLTDPRFSDAGVLPPKKYSDLLFVEHILYHMRDDGRAAVLVPNGTLFRGGKEKMIRKHILSLNCLDAVIGLPEKLFHTTGIPCTCLVFDKQKKDEEILFVDASQYFKKGKKQNELTEEDVNRIMDAYARKEDIERFCRMVSLDEIKENDFNLNIPRYVDSSEEEPEIILEDVKDRMLGRKEKMNQIAEELKKYFDELQLDFPF